MASDFGPSIAEIESINQNVPILGDLQDKISQLCLIRDLPLILVIDKRSSSRLA